MLLVCYTVLLSKRDITCTAGGGPDPGGEEAGGEGASPHEQHRHHGEGDRVCTHYFNNHLHVPTTSTTTCSSMKLHICML